MLDLLIVGFILLLGLSPALLQLAQRTGWLPQQRRLQQKLQRRLRRQLQNQAANQAAWTTSPRWSWLGLASEEMQPETREIEGVGIVIGDLSCAFNGRSPLLRCAINPFGPCAGCSSYEPKSELTP